MQTDMVYELLRTSTEYVIFFSSQHLDQMAVIVKEDSTAFLLTEEILAQSVDNMLSTTVALHESS